MRWHDDEMRWQPPPSLIGQICQPKWLGHRRVKFDICSFFYTKKHILKMLHASGVDGFKISIEVSELQSWKLIRRQLYFL